jgi:hypothetical protein
MNWIYWDTFWSLLFGTVAFLTITNNPVTSTGVDLR